MNIKRGVSLLLPAILILCACFSACGEPKAGFRTAAEKYLAFLGKTREEVLTGLKLAEGDLSPDSTDICAVLDSNEQFCGQKFSTQLFFDSTDPETGETTDAPLLVSVKFLHSSPEPGPQEYEPVSYTHLDVYKRQFQDPGEHPGV